MQNRKILIAESDPSTAKIVSKLLGEFGYPVVDVVTSNGAAFTSAVKYKPALVLLGDKLEGSKNYLSSGQMIIQYFGIPVIFMTNEDTYPQEFIRKPIQKDELKSTIDLFF